ncbi:MAG: NAD(P)H-hydrate dehydratase [Nitrososphaeria archaeon]
MVTELTYVDENFIRGNYPVRKKDSHKGENGRVLVIGGSWIYHGAPYIASLAALISGVDLVYTAVPKPIVSAIRCLDPNLIVIPLPDYKFTKGNAERLIKIMPEVDVVLIGNGMGKGIADGLKLFLKETIVKKVILDADALLPESVSVLSSSDKDFIVTPHGGEFKRISGFDVEGKDIEEKAKLVMGFAKDKGATVLLKGVIDIISDSEELYLNSTGNAGMTVGGTGDALAGLTAGFFSKGLKAVKASALAAFVNGSAGDLALNKKGLHFTAMDLISFYPEIMKKFDRLV